MRSCCLEVQFYLMPRGSWSSTGPIDHIIQNNPKARQNPRGLSQLDGYKRGLVNSLTGNLQKFGLDRVPKVETLEEVL
jgi:hypothetical protein